MDFTNSASPLQQHTPVPDPAVPYDPMQQTTGVQPDSQVPSLKPPYTMPKPEPEVRIIEREKPEGRGFHIPNPFKPIFWLFKAIRTIRQLILTGCLLVIFSIVGLILVLIFKPPVLWNPLKDFLNWPITPPQITATTVQQVVDRINRDGKDQGFVSLNESEATALFKQKVQTGTDLRINMEDQLMEMLINIETTEHPLWLVTDMQQDKDANLNITKIGFGRIGIPDGINSFLSNQLFGIITLTRDQLSNDKSVKLFNVVLDGTGVDKRLQLKSVAFSKDQLILNFNYTSTPGF